MVRIPAASWSSEAAGGQSASGTGPWDYSTRGPVTGGWIARVRFPEPLEFSQLRELPGAIVVASGKSGRIWSVPLTQSNRFGKIRQLLDLGRPSRFDLSYRDGLKSASGPTFVRAQRVPDPVDELESQKP